jgi:dihydropteroate synthase
MLDKPMLVGVSRKSMLYKLLDTTAENALNATTAANMIALQNGAQILRVHDVKEAMECVKIWKAMMNI